MDWTSWAIAGREGTGYASRMKHDCHVEPSARRRAASIARWCFVVTLAGCSSPADRAVAPGGDAKQTPEPSSEGAVSSLGGEVVAAAPDGAVVLRTETEMRAEDAAQSGWPLVGVPIEDEPGRWFGVARGASHVVYADPSGALALWRRGDTQAFASLDPDVLGEDRIAIPFEGPAPRSGQSWGPPVFLDDATIATHHAEGVILWETATGKARCYVVDPLIQLSRASYALGEERAALRSSSNTPDLTNAALLEFSKKDCQIGRVHLLPVDQPYLVAGTSTSTLVLRAGSLRASSGVEPARVMSLPLGTPHAIDQPVDGVIAWAAQAEASDEVEVGLLDTSSGRMRVVGQLPAGTRVVHVRRVGADIRALEQSGDEHTWAAPALATEQPRTFVAVSADEAARERALSYIGRGDRVAAIQALAGKDGPGPSNRFLHAYFVSFEEQSSEEDFRAKLAKHGIRFTGDAQLYLAIEHLVDVQAWPQATDLFFYWVDDAPPKTLPAEAIEIGLELALQLAELDRYELRERLLDALAKQYPDDPKVAEARRDDEE